MASTQAGASGPTPSAAWALKNPSDALATFQNGLTVDLIATARPLFRTCAADEALKTVVEHNRAENFDFLPVTESRGASSDTNRIVGLIELVAFMTGDVPDRSVHQAMRPLSEENLVGADATILNFVRGADRQQCRLIVSGSTISGLVSLSDLQRLPVRAALFGMVTHIEMMMANSIRKEFGAGADWMERLSDNRQLKLHEQMADAKSKDAYVEALLFTQFGDKITILKKRPNSPFDTGDFKRDLNRIQALRDDLAHANEYAASRNDACYVCETVRLMDTWIERLASAESTSGSG